MDQRHHTNCADGVDTCAGRSGLALHRAGVNDARPAADQHLPASVFADVDADGYGDDISSGPASFFVAVLAWLLVALPVLVYLFSHPHELDTPRGADLLMAYGPVIVLVVVLLPVRQGLATRMQQLASERARMEIMVNRDPLTSIYNRRLGEQVMQDMLTGKVPAGVIMFDMDRFKAINDTYGHPAGDRVLQGVAHRCKDLLRKDECLTRWGGEEFLVVVPDVDAAGLRQLAERLRSAIAELPIERLPRVTASVGIALIQGDDNLVILLKRVDQALYRAKQQGGNCVMS